MPNSSFFEMMFRFGLNINVIRQVPEGVCRRCDGTGAGEALAELGEAFSKGLDFPIRACKACSGTGMAVAKAHVTALGALLLFPIAAAMYHNARKTTATSHLTVPALAGPPTRDLFSLRDAISADTSSVAPEQRGLAVSIKQHSR